VTRSNLNRQHAIDLSENDSAQHIAAGHRPALRSGPRMHLFAWSLVLAALLFAGNLFGQTNFPVRIMAANITSGNSQSYEAPGIRIFQGLKPDIVAIQEFQVAGGSSSNDLRTLVDTAFGSEFSFYCEPNTGIPNGIVSRWPILAAGVWDDPFLTDRDFAWARINIPGTNDLYVVSVHLHGSGGPVKNKKNPIVNTIHPIIHHGPLHGAGSSHNPIVVSTRDCNDPNTLCRRP